MRLVPSMSPGALSGRQRYLHCRLKHHPLAAPPVMGTLPHLLHHALKSPSNLGSTEHKSGHPTPDGELENSSIPHDGKEPSHWKFLLPLESSLLLLSLSPPTPPQLEPSTLVFKNFIFNFFYFCFIYYILTF